MDKYGKISELFEYYMVSTNTTPEEMYKIFELVGRDYNEEYYTHWLAKYIIDRCKEEKVDYNEIFTKKVRILHALNKGTYKFNERFLDLVKGFNVKGNALLSVSDDLPKVQKIVLSPTEEMDISRDNLFYLDKADAFTKESILKDNNTVIIKENPETVKGKTPSRVSAGVLGYNLDTVFDHQVFRLTNMIANLDLVNTDILLITSVDAFITNPDLANMLEASHYCSKALIKREFDINDNVLGGNLLITYWSQGAGVSLYSAKSEGTDDIKVFMRTTHTLDDYKSDDTNNVSESMVKVNDVKSYLYGEGLVHNLFITPEVHIKYDNFVVDALILDRFGPYRDLGVLSNPEVMAKEDENINLLGHYASLEAKEFKDFMSQLTAGITKSIKEGSLGDAISQIKKEVVVTRYNTLYNNLIERLLSYGVL